MRRTEFVLSSAIACMLPLAVTANCFLLVSSPFLSCLLLAAGAVCSGGRNYLNS